MRASTWRSSSSSWRCSSGSLDRTERLEIICSIPFHECWRCRDVSCPRSRGICPHAARCHPADLRVRRNPGFSYLRSWLRPRCRVRERVPSLLRPEHGREKGSSDIPRRSKRGRAATELCPDWKRTAVEPVLRGRGRHGPAPMVGAPATGTARRTSRRSLWDQPSTAPPPCCSRSPLLGAWLGRAPPRRSGCGSGRRCSSTCTWRPRLLARVLGVRRRIVRHHLAEGTRALERRRRRRARPVGRADGHGSGTGRVPGVGAGGGFRDIGMTQRLGGLGNGRAELPLEEVRSGIGSARGPSAARSRRARASGGGAPRALINADRVAPGVSRMSLFAIGLLPDAAPTKRSTAASDRRRSSRGR